MSNFASNDNMTALFTATGEKIGERAKIFPGTKAEWDALPLSEKIKYDYVAFAGDSQSGIVDDVPTEDSENLVKSGGVFDSLATKANLTQITNPNILHNPWFQVNQRGATSTSSNGYFVDRWRVLCATEGTTTYTLNSDGTITIDNSLGETQAYFIQRRTAKTISRVAGRTITASVMFSDGTVHSGSGTYVDTETTNYYEDDDIKIQSIAQSSGQFFVLRVEAGKSVTIKALKLEIGEISTLAMDSAPDMATELAKCQRYFYRLESTGGNDWIALGKAWTASAVNVIIPIPSMRALPTASVSDMTKLLVAKGSSTLDPHRISQILVGYYKKFGSSIALTLTLSDSTATNGDNYVLKAEAPVNIDFSAEL